METTSTAGHTAGLLIPVILAAICAAAVSFLAVSVWQSTLKHARGAAEGSTKDLKCVRCNVAVLPAVSSIVIPDMAFGLHLESIIHTQLSTISAYWPTTKHACMFHAPH